MSGKPGGKKKQRAELSKVESQHRPAWTVLVSHMLDKLRVNALSENRSLGAGGLIGSRVSLQLTFFPDKVREYIERVPLLVGIPRQLPEGMTERDYRAMVLDYPEGDGMSIMQILADRIAHGDQEFMEDFSKELKPLNCANDNRVALLLALSRNPREIEAAERPADIIRIIRKRFPEIEFEETNFRTLLKKVGLPLKKANR